MTDEAPQPKRTAQHRPNTPFSLGSRDNDPNNDNFGIAMIVEPSTSSMSAGRVGTIMKEA